MSEKKKIFVRLGFSDMLIEKEELKDLKLTCINQKGEGIDLGCYLITYELEDGSECTEDGELLEN